jgi:4'-phosphopantetheinyl transferase
MSGITVRRSRIAAPPPGVVEVWFVPLAPPPVPLATLTAVLDPRQQSHANRMRVGGEAWAAAHGALRIVLSHYVRQPASALRFKGTGLHKPELLTPNAPRYSLSHTDGLALIAVASDRDVGVDVELENDRTDIDALSRDFLQPVDVAVLGSAAPEARRKAFFAAWTRHEARAKLHGRGMESGPADMALPPGGLVLVRALSTPPGFAAAVAAEGGNWTVRMRALTEAL